MFNVSLILIVMHPYLWKNKQNIIMIRITITFTHKKLFTLQVHTLQSHLMLSDKTAEDVIVLTWKGLGSVIHKCYTESHRNTKSLTSLPLGR